MPKPRRRTDDEVNRMNKTFLKALEKKTDKELLEIAYAFKVASRVYSQKAFQEKYDAILFELKQRKLTR